MLALTELCLELYVCIYVCNAWNCKGELNSLPLCIHVHELSLLTSWSPALLQKVLHKNEIELFGE